jgi:hypothetical protein
MLAAGRTDAMAVMQPTPGTVRKLESLQVELKRTFPQLPPEHVEIHLRSVTANLLERAHFDDFVPLLAHRQVHELLEMEQQVAPGAS